MHIATRRTSLQCTWYNSNPGAALWEVAAHPATQEQHCGKLLCIQQLSCIRCCWGASSNSAALCAVGAHPENHLPRWVPPHALLARGSVDGTTKMAAPSTQPPSGRPSEQGRRGRCFSTCHLAAHSAPPFSVLCATCHSAVLPTSGSPPSSGANAALWQTAAEGYCRMLQITEVA